MAFNSKNNNKNKTNKNIDTITKSKTLIIMDWDDTLFPTDWAIKNNINFTSAETRDQYMVYFQELDRSLYKLIKTSMKLGKVVIVTNALLDWIQISSLVLPNTYHLLKKIKIVSARGTYKSKSSVMMDWKMMAFRDVVNSEFSNESLLNVISIGDAEYEYQALIALKEHKKGTKKYLKSIRFIKDPTHDTLVDQLSVLTSAIVTIWNHEQHLDLKLESL